MTDRPRLIEVAFPLKETSLDSVHEKNVRHGHISTLHVWPARRPLAASRAALIATLLPDPGDAEKRRELLLKLGGKVVTNPKTGKEATEGGVLHWGRESSPDMDWFREEIRKAYGGRAPRVLDPFSGGGAIPLEAMRLGCEVTAVDINPVAWFILKCTLEYPQKLAGKKLPLPKFAMELSAFRRAWEDAQVKAGKKKGKQKAGTIDMFEHAPEADLAWHVRAWGHWVLEHARKDLEKYYPVIDGKPVVAYLWARTVRCKDCGAIIPLLKTRWLCQKKGKSILLGMTPTRNRNGVTFDIRAVRATSTRERKAGAGTISKSGAQCPCCPLLMKMDDLRLAGQDGKLASVMTAVVVDGKNGKEYRLPTSEEIELADASQAELEQLASRLPFGMPRVPINTGSVRKGGVSITRWGIREWDQVFTKRQLRTLLSLSIGIGAASNAFHDHGYDEQWREALLAFLAAQFDRVLNQSSMVARWNKKGENVEGTFSRFALPLLWDYAEVNPLGETTGSMAGAGEWISLAATHMLAATAHAGPPATRAQSAKKIGREGGKYDAIVTDPPYYDAIPYADLTDFFYVWLRRILNGATADIDNAFREPTAPKWNVEEDDGELIDDESRFGGDRNKSKVVYESGLFHVFRAGYQALTPEGRLVIVFANKQPEAWETLASAIIRAGYIVDGSWPIQTERTARARSLSSAALSSSVWLVCRKRPETARPGWDNKVLEDMRARIHERLRDFWDAGIRGPDFVWAATGPALEPYSRHPVIKKANEPGQVMTVAEFLRHVRRMVVDFAVGRLLTSDGGEAVSGLDDITTYYLLHRHYFGMDKAPAGAAILYALSCGVSDRDLVERHEILERALGKATDESANNSDKDDADENDEDTSDDEEEEEEEEEEETEAGGGKGNKVKLKAWDQRKSKNLGMDVEGRPASLVDQVHRLMHLWRAGDQAKVNAYLDARVLWKNALFHQILQAFIELSPEGSEERNILEAISNHVGVKGKAVGRQMPLPV
ncbi:DUF1156 domain-containing protein [Sorangium sp. So ce1128]